MSTTYNRVPNVSALTIETQKFRETEKQRDSETERHQDLETQTKRKRQRKRGKDKVNERARRTHTHTHTYEHTHKHLHTIDDRAHLSILRCPLELDELKGQAFMFIRLRYLEILLCPSSPVSAPSPARPPRPQMALSTVPMLHTHPFLPHPPSTLSFTFPFLLWCP